MVEPQIWSRRCFIDCTKMIAGSGASTDISLRALTRDVTIAFGGRAMSIMALSNDGFAGALESEGKCTVTIDGFVTDAGNSAGVTVNSVAYYLGLAGLFYESSDSSEPLSVESSSVEPTPNRLAFLWTNDTSATKATATTAASTYSKRVVLANGYMTKLPELKWSGNPKQLEMTAEWEFMARNRYGFPNYRFESGRATALPALSNYNETDYGETVSSRTW